MEAEKRSQLSDLRIDRSARRPPGRGGIVALAVVLLGSVAAGMGWWLSRPTPVRVTTELAREVSAGGQSTVLNASGYVTARRKATVSSKVTGKVVELLIEEGMRVVEGQILARLDAANVDVSLQLAAARLRASQSALAETRVRLVEAEANLRRTAELVRQRVGSDADLDRERASRDSLVARLGSQTEDVEVARRELELWRQQLDDTVIRAPFAGVVVAKNAQPGEMISPMSSGGFTRTGIGTVVDMSSLEIEVDVNESYIDRVRPGQAVEAVLDAYQAWRIPCRVIAIIPTADRQRATVEVRIGFAEMDDRILPDMGVKVAFRSDPSTADAEQPAARSVAVAVPKGALRSLDGRDVVFVATGDRVERRAVTIASAGADEVLLSSGLRAGDRVVVTAASALVDGQAVVEAK